MGFHDQIRGHFYVFPSNESWPLVNWISTSVLSRTLLSNQIPAINNTGCCPEACHCKLGETVMAKGFGRTYLQIIDPLFRSVTIEHSVEFQRSPDFGSTDLLCLIFDDFLVIFRYCSETPWNFSFIFCLFMRNNWEMVEKITRIVEI